jgi:hypothetical protein
MRPRVLSLSDRLRNVTGVSEEAQMAEVEKTLLYISEARQRSERAARELEQSGGEQHLIDALRNSTEALSDAHRQLMQATFFAVSKTQETLQL